MSIASDIQALASSLSDILAAINTKLTGKGSTSAGTLAEVPSKIEAIPAGTEPTGTKSITSNGTHDVKNYASASVNVPVGITPSGNKTITTNGTHDVTAYAGAVVDVPTGITPTGTKTITSNGNHDVTSFANALVDVDTGYIIEQSYVTASATAHTLSYTDAEANFDSVKGLIIRKVDVDTNEDIAFLAVCPIGGTDSYKCYMVRTISAGVSVVDLGNTAVDFGAGGSSFHVSVESWVGSFSTTSDYIVSLIKAI